MAHRAGLAAFLSLTTLAGCGSDPGIVPSPVLPPPPQPLPPRLELPDDDEAVFLDIWRPSHGFVPIEYSLGRPSLFLLTVGGDLWTEGPVAEIYPGALLPNIQHARLSSAALARVIRAVERTALPGTSGTERILELADILADAPTTEFALTDRSGVHRIQVYGLFADSFRDPRVAPLKALIETLAQVEREAGAEEWVGDRLQVWALTSEPFHDADLGSERPWPLPVAPPSADEQFGRDCHVFEGDDAASLHEEFRRANHGVRWNHEGALYQLLPRPLAPGEPGCER